MLVAFISDIHGNLPALEAALARIDGAGVQTVLNTGDAVGGGPWPDAVVERLRGRGVPGVQGERDRQVGRFLKAAAKLRRRVPAADLAALQWTYEALSSANLEYLNGLPRQAVLSLEGLCIVLCHGAPGGPAVALGPDAPDALFRRQRERCPADIYVCGRTHQPFHRWVDGALFVNPGSLGGLPGTYALVNTEETPWTVEICRVDYDRAAVEVQARACGMPSSALGAP